MMEPVREEDADHQMAGSFIRRADSITAREHAYLPGTPHPLMPEHLLRRKHQLKTSGSGMLKLPILVLAGVVPFPGTKIPVRLSNLEWKRYFQKLIDERARDGGDAITLGILTHVPVSISNTRRSWARSALMSGTQPIDLNQLLQDSSDESEPEQEAEWASRTSRSSSISGNAQDRLIGRIGTMMAITTHYTTEQNASSGCDLVFRAVGTRRFRIVESLQDRPQYHRDSILFYMVQPIDDNELNLRSNLLPGPWLDISDKLAHVTAIPKYAYDRRWPWKLVTEIYNLIDKSKDGGLKNSILPGLGPNALSFWLASNMVLKESERLELLAMDTALERLRILLEKLSHQSSILCRGCNSLVGDASDVFSVGGAEGTTGAYVNCYGAIHQTTTLRHIREDRVLYDDSPPDIRDSWFPGYGWTIVSCGSCHAHLGWLFTAVSSGDSTEDDADRPYQFWGLSGTGVTTRKLETIVQPSAEV